MIPAPESAPNRFGGFAKKIVANRVNIARTRLTPDERQPNEAHDNVHKLRI